MDSLYFNESGSEGEAMELVAISDPEEEQEIQELLREGLRATGNENWIDDFEDMLDNQSIASSRETDLQDMVDNVSNVSSREMDLQSYVDLLCSEPSDEELFAETTEMLNDLAGISQYSKKNSNNNNVNKNKREVNGNVNKHS